MKIWARRTRLWAVLSLSAASVCAGVTALSAPPAASAPPASTASAAPSETGTGSTTGTLSAASAASAAPSGASAEELLPWLKGSEIPKEPSEAPKKQDWAAAQRVRPRRQLGGPCRFTALREWLRIQCEGILGGTLVGGDPKDVTLMGFGGPFVAPDKVVKAGGSLALTDPPSRTIITLRLTRGGAWVFSLLAADVGYTPTMFEARYVTVSWPEHEEDPLILVSKGVP